MRRRAVITPDIKAEVVQQYTTRLPDGTWKGSKLIGRDLGMSDTTVRNILSAEGVPIRSAKEAHAHGKRCGRIKHTEQFDAPPLCACGCGIPVHWLSNSQEWARFVTGHRYQDAPHKNKDWLHEQYEVLHRSAPEIAAQCHVHTTTIIRHLERCGISRRDASASKIGRFSGNRNPAWKGGIAKWGYAPEWKRIARIVRKRDNYACQECNALSPKQSKYLHVHHIDGDKTNNDLINLVTVCAKCHPKGKRKENFNRLKDPHWRTKWIISQKGEALGVDADKYLTSVEASHRIGVKPAAIVKMIRAGRIVGKRISWYWYAERGSFEEFARTYKYRGKYQ